MVFSLAVCVEWSSVVQCGAVWCVVSQHLMSDAASNREHYSSRQQPEEEEEGVRLQAQEGESGEKRDPR